MYTVEIAWYFKTMHHLRFQANWEWCIVLKYHDVFAKFWNVIERIFVLTWKALIKEKMGGFFVSWVFFFFWYDVEHRTIWVLNKYDELIFANIRAPKMVSYIRSKIFVWKDVIVKNECWSFLTDIFQKFNCIQFMSMLHKMFNGSIKIRKLTNHCFPLFIQCH